MLFPALLSTFDVYNKPYHYALCTAASFPPTELINLTAKHRSTHWSAHIKRPLLILPGYLAGIKIGGELF